ncbi:MAG: amidohydrolase family protein [Myxococcota bacterium]
MTRDATIALAVAVAVVLAGPEASAACTALVHGTAWLPDGPADDVTVLVEGDRVAGVGADLAIPEGCEVVDASDRVITPGLVDVHTGLGLVEIGLEKATRDTSAEVEREDVPSIRAGFAVRDAYNPRSTAIPVTRIEGVTSALTVPSGGLVHGRSAWVDLAGATQDEAVRKEAAALHAHVGGGEGSRAQDLHRLRLLLGEARDFARKEADWARNRMHPLRHPASELRAVQPVLAGEMPLVVRVDRASDIEAVLRLAEEFGLRLVVDGGAEAWMLADRLAEREVPVIVDPLLNQPESFDHVHARADNAALLAEAGVPVMLSTYSSHNPRTLRQVAGNAVRAGLPRGAALRAVTRTPAEVFGMAGHGRLESGARANLVVWSGDPLELSTAVDKVLVGGRDIPLVSRQTILRDRYLDLPGTPQEPLPLP